MPITLYWFTHFLSFSCDLLYFLLSGSFHCILLFFFLVFFFFFFSLTMLFFLYPLSPKSLFFLPLNPFLYLFLIRRFPYILILHLFLLSIWCLPPSHSWWVPLPVVLQRIRLHWQKRYSPILPFHLLLYLHYSIGWVLPHAVSLPRGWIWGFSHKLSQIFSAGEPPVCNVGAGALLEASSRLGTGSWTRQGRSKTSVTRGFLGSSYNLPSASP